MICPQHFHNIFTTNPKWQVTTDCYCWGKKVILVSYHFSFLFGESNVQTANKSQSVQFLHLFRILHRIILALLLLKTIICILIRHQCVLKSHWSHPLPIFHLPKKKEKDTSVEARAYVRVHLKTITIIYIYDLI